MLIGIAGGSCTGKTTLLQELQARLGESYASLSFDDYFVGVGQLTHEVTDWETPDLYRYDAFMTDLQALKSGKLIMRKTKSRESTKQGIKEKVIVPKPFTFIEGFLIFHDPVARDVFDARIFIELPEEVIIKRRLARSEGTSRWDDPDYIANRLIPGHKKYVEPQRKYADLVIDGRQSIREMASEILAFLG